MSQLPAAGVSVRVVPGRLDFTEALDPIDLVSPGATTAEDGRFAVSIPERGSGQLLIGGGTVGKVRYAYPEASDLPPVTDLGDIELPLATDVFVLLPAGLCELHAAGPIDSLGVEIVEGVYEPGEQRYHLSLPEPGF